MRESKLSLWGAQACQPQIVYDVWLYPNQCHLTLLRVEQRGLGAALRAGIDYALRQAYAGVITIDGNGKDGVQAIPTFI